MNLQRCSFQKALGLLFLMLFVLAPTAGHAVIFTVNTTLDAPDANIDGVCLTAAGQCTLRAAIQEANATAALDEIILPAGTITFTLQGVDNTAAAGDLDIGLAGLPSQLTITGQGQTQTIINGNGLDRVFETVASGTTATIRLMTIRNGAAPAGQDGGCIKVGAGTSLVLNDAVVTGCTAPVGGGGIDNTGTLTMSIVSVATNSSTGGAINSGANSTTTWIDGEVSGNTGGGINNQGTMSLTNVTVSGNTTLESGAGIDNRGGLNLLNVTISNNTAPAVVNNVGGLRNRDADVPAATATPTNTIISGNIPTNCGGTITDGGNNIANDTTCGFGAAADPLLSPLALNGGVLRTHALGIGSPAIDTGNQTACVNLNHDARGFPRPVDGNIPLDGTATCDIGAFEFRPQAIAAAPTSIDFGTVTIAASADQTLTISNGGDGGLAISTIAAPAAPFSKLADNCSGATLGIGGSCTLLVRFSPTTVVVSSASLTVPSNDPLVQALPVPLTGTGAAGPVPNISVTDSVAPNNDLSVPFGNVTVGSTADATITVTNTGAANLVIATLAGANLPAAPFSITSDTCSGQTIAPNASCAMTVRFAPTTNTSSADQIGIPNNDPDSQLVTVNLSGSGISTAGNNPPSIPVLVSPENGATVPAASVTFTWERSTDPNGDPVTHRFFNCPDQTFTAAGCAPVDVAAAPVSKITFAGLGSLGAGVILLGFVAGTGFRRSRKVMLIVLTLLLTGVFFAACNGGGGGGAPAQMTHTVTGLTPNTTYFWKVVADDGRGGTATSEVRSFTAQ